MNKIEIDIISDIIKNTLALHEFGKPARDYLAQYEDINEPTLLLLDLSKANPMDYEFVNIAFSNLIQHYKTNSNLFIVFKANKWERNELIIGLADILGLDRPSADKKATLIAHGFNTIIFNENNEPEYIANLDGSHNEVLKFIEEKECSSSEIQSKFSLIPEKLSKILDNLILYKFIYRVDGSGDPKYYSIKSLITKP